jgi:hypothetical protein
MKPITMHLIVLMLKLFECPIRPLIWISLLRAFCVVLIVLGVDFLNAFFRSFSAFLKALEWLHPFQRISASI